MNAARHHIVSAVGIQKGRAQSRVVSRSCIYSELFNQLSNRNENRRRMPQVAAALAVTPCGALPRVHPIFFANASTDLDHRFFRRLVKRCHFVWCLPPSCLHFMSNGRRVTVSGSTERRYPSRGSIAARFNSTRIILP